MVIQEAFVTEIKSQYLDSSADKRVEHIFAKIVERLQEEPDEGDKWMAKSLARPRSKSALGQQWDLYILKSMESIKKRENKLDEAGQPRVLRIYRGSGSLRYIDLMDYKGRHRVRLFFDSAGQATEMMITSTKGVETTYNKENFDPQHMGATAGSSNLGERFDKARRHSVTAAESDSEHHHKSMAEESVKTLCSEIFPQLEEILKRERDESRQILPTAEEILEMDLEKILEHVDKCKQPKSE